MNLSRTFLLFTFLFLSNNALQSKKTDLSFEKGDMKGSVTGKFHTTTVFDVGSLLNEEAYEVDKALATKTTINLKGSLQTSQVKMCTDIKSAALWGNNRQLKTSKSTIKNIVILAH